MQKQKIETPPQGSPNIPVETQPDEILQIETKPQTLTIETKPRTSQTETLPQILTNETLPKTFLELYLKGCKLLDEQSNRQAMYQELDRLWIFIKENPEKEKFEYAVSGKRSCIAIPYDIVKDTRLPPDGETDRGILLYYACPGYDKYLSHLIDQMIDTSGLDIYHTIPTLNKWKLMRLGRVVDMGWEEFVKSYLKPLEDKRQYLRNFTMAANAQLELGSTTISNE